MPRSLTLRYDLILLLAAVIWGFAFVAQRMGMEHIGPFMFNAIRFGLGAGVIAVVIKAREAWRHGGRGAGGHGGMEAWGHGGMEAWRHGGMEAWRRGRF
jgi:drug/metabolite transporter (DMT)-like permease